MCKLFFLEILTIWEVDAISLLWWLFNFPFLQYDVDDGMLMSQTEQSVPGNAFTLLAAGAGQARGLDDTGFVFVEGLLISSCSLRLDMLVEEAL